MSLDMAKERKRKKSKLSKAETLELESLEKALLGKGRSILETVEELVSNDSSETSKKAKIVLERKPAWEDPDDVGLKVNDVLAAQGRPKMGVPGKPNDDYLSVMKTRFATRIGNPEWAKLDQEDEDEILKRCGNFISKGRDALLRGILDIKKLHNLNKSRGREGPYINAVQFHPSATAALVAGTAGIVSIFQVDGMSNPHLQSVKFENFPVRCARFSRDGNQFIVGSQHHSHYYVYDMVEGRSIRIPTHHATQQTNMKRFEVSPDGSLIAVCGRFGAIHLLDGRTREWIGTLQMNGEVTALSFNPSGSQLWTHGDGGEVYIWDVLRRTCLHRFIDEGCLQGRSVAVAPSAQLVACGSSSGVVNVYDAQTALSSRSPTPLRVVMNLVTAATALSFNPTSEILAISSDDKDGALKLVHLPSITVFGNFPTKETGLGRVQCHNFSPGSGFLATGNSQHVAQLFRLKHFGNY